MATPNQIRLDAYLAAEIKILSGQSVRVEDREIRRADLQFVQKQIAALQVAVAREQQAAASPGRLRGFSQADFGGDW